MRCSRERGLLLLCACAKRVLKGTDLMVQPQTWQQLRIVLTSRVHHPRYEICSNKSRRVRLGNRIPSTKIREEYTVQTGVHQVRESFAVSGSSPVPAVVFPLPAVLDAVSWLSVRTKMTRGEKKYRTLGRRVLQRMTRNDMTQRLRRRKTRVSGKRRLTVVGRSRAMNRSS